MMRKEIEGADITAAMTLLNVKLAEAFARKGPMTASSRHEILGLVEEEMCELKVATRISLDEFNNELMDVAVAAIFGLLSIQKGVEW